MHRSRPHRSIVLGATVSRALFAYKRSVWFWCNKWYALDAVQPVDQRLCQQHVPATLAGSAMFSRGCAGFGGLVLVVASGPFGCVEVQMDRRAMSKIVAFIPPDLLGKYDALADRYGMSRSELCRLALQRGYLALAKWCASAHAVGDDPVDASPSGRTVSTRLAGPSVAGRGDLQSQVQSLRQFCKVLLEQEPQEFSADQLQMAVIAQAAVLGFGSEQARQIADRLVAEIFPQPVDLDRAGSDGEGPLVDLD